MPGSGQATRCGSRAGYSCRAHRVRKENTMKRVGLWAIGIGLLLGAGPLGAEPGPAEKGAPPKCTLSTLKGRYLFGGLGSVGPSSLAVAGYHIFNGDGTGKDVLSATLDGQSIENQLSNPDRSEYDITYTVNADCSGTYAVPAAGVSFGLFVAPDGAEVIVIGLTPGFTLVQGPNRRVSPK